ncbi:MAG TPA: hypothetical protein VFN67_04700 [Polyangiales bacterium]|nr:hypothetical protein [Polyangiales bacterium]
MPGSTQRGLFFSTLAAALLLGLTLQWPSLDGGFRSDDYVQWAMFHGEFPAPRSKLDLFSFADGTLVDREQLTDFGHLPWWSHPELRLRMWRPLASALMSLDFAWFDRDARLHHVHTLVWFCLLLIAAGRLLWRVLPPLQAAIALGLFASAPCHTLPVGWLANRSTLVACTWAFVALDLHLLARERRTLGPRLGCALASCIALLCGEYALSALVYGLCFSLLLHPTGSRRKQLQAISLDALPVLAPLCGYLVLHTSLGRDIIHSGYYISPFGAPGDFLHALVTRVPVLSADLLFGLPSYYDHSGGFPLRTWFLSLNLLSPDIWLRLPDWTTCHVWIGYLALVFGVGVYAWLRRKRSTEQPPAWLALGTLLSLLPCAGSLPEDRLLTAATLGSSALFASLLVAAARALRHPPRRALTLALLLMAAWLPVSAFARSYDDARMIRDGSELARAWCLDAELPEVDAQHTRVYVISTADFNTAVNLPWLRRVEANKPLPLSYRRLIPGPSPVRIVRENDRSLEAQVVISDVYGTAVPALYRDAAAPVTPGERQPLPGFVATVLETYADNPVRMRFEFDRSLDDPSIWFVAATDHGVRRIAMPAIGQSILVPFAQYRDVRIPAE